MLDFMRMRPYRETLLCKADRPLRRYFAADDFKRLLFASQAAPCEGEAAGSNAFEVPGGARIESNHPGVIRLLEALGKAWPRALNFEELVSRVEGTGLTFDGEGATLLMRLAVSRMMELRAWRAPLAEGISARPRASACSRQEGRMGAAATSLLHLTVSLDDAKVRGLLQLLDGARDRSELMEAMKKEFPASPAAEIEEGLEPSLRLFYMAGVLEA
jgi:PKMT, C-terminal winged helix domain